MGSSRQESSFFQRMLGFLLLDAIYDGQNLMRRWRENEPFRRYVGSLGWRSKLFGALIVCASFAYAGVGAVYAARAGSVVVLLVMLLTPVVLAASLATQGYMLFSWFEGRALRKALGRSRAPAPGPIARWILRKLQVDLRPFPSVPWIPALLFVLAPLVMLAQLSAKAATILVALQFLSVLLVAYRDRETGSRSGGEAPRRERSSPAPEK